MAEGARRQAAALDLKPLAVTILRADLYIVRALDDAELVRNAQAALGAGLLPGRLHNDRVDELNHILFFIVRDVRLDELTTEELDIMPHFKNPAMPSVAVTADAAIKIASARKEFSSTDTFLEMIGFDQADIRRIKAQEQRVRGQQLIVEVDNADNGEYVD